MRMTLLPGIVLLAAPVLAQEPADATAKRPAVLTYERILAEFTAERAEFTAKRRELTQTEEYKKLRADRDAEGLNELMATIGSPDTTKYTARFMAGAARYAHSEDAVPFLSWVFTNSPDKETVELVVQEAVVVEEVVLMIKAVLPQLVMEEMDLQAEPVVESTKEEVELEEMEEMVLVV